MTKLDSMARKLKTLLGQNGFVRRDRKGRALFVSDYPARLSPEQQNTQKNRLREAGFEVVYQDGLALIDWPYAGYLDFFKSLSDKIRSGGLEGRDGLARIFERHPLSFTETMLPDARAALLLWDRGQMERLRIQAGAALAAALRQKTPVPLYYPLLLSETTDQKKEDPLC